jgi:hypothetical protein
VCRGRAGADRRGSPLSSRRDPATPRITGSLLGTGASRTLHYNVRAIPDEKVTFFDVGPQGAREIGTANGGSTGALTLTPAPGSATHFVDAEIEMAGLPVPMLGGAGAGAATASSVGAAQDGAAKLTIARFRRRGWCTPAGSATCDSSAGARLCG